MTFPRWSHFAAAPRLYSLAGRLVPWCAGAAVLLAAYGLFVGLAVAPTDFQQGEAYRIIFVHVPSAWMAMILYLAMAFWCAVGLVFNVRTAFMLAQAIAPTGALMAFLALWTGAVWGKPTWGTW
jgi:heme exporter protein C